MPPAAVTIDSPTTVPSPLPSPTGSPVPSRCRHPTAALSRHDVPPLPSTTSSSSSSVLPHWTAFPPFRPRHCNNNNNINASAKPNADKTHKTTTSSSCSPSNYCQSPMTMMMMPPLLSSNSSRVPLCPDVSKSLWHCMQYQFHLMARVSAECTVSTNMDSSPRLMSPADVYFDASARAALQVLRETSSVGLFFHTNDANCNSRRPSPKQSSKAPPPRRRRRRPQHQRPPSNRLPEDDFTTSDEDDTEDDDQSSLADDASRRAAALHLLRARGDRHRGVLTLMGFKGASSQQQKLPDGPVNQDRAFVVDPLVPPSVLPYSTCCAVLDGHGPLGHVVADYCHQQLEWRLATLPTYHLTPSAMLHELVSVVEEVDESLPDALAFQGGTTLTCVVQLGQDVYLVNAGDSQSLVAAYCTQSKKTWLLQLTRRDVPQLPSEAARIRAAGATVSKDGYVLYHKRGHEVGLAMSRSLGDRGAPGVIATPLIQHFTTDELVQLALELAVEPLAMLGCDTDDDDEEHHNHHNSRDETWRRETILGSSMLDLLGSSSSSRLHNTTTSSASASTPSWSIPTPPTRDDIRLFAMSVSDGILDVMSASEVARVMGAALYNNDNSNNSGGVHPLTATEAVLHTAAERWYEESHGQYRDDCSIAVTKLHPYPETTTTSSSRY